VARPLGIVLLVLAAACDCGGGDDATPQDQPKVGDACTQQSQCGSALVCHAGQCATSLPAAATCANPGAAPTLLAGAPVVANDPGAGVCTFGVRDFALPLGDARGQVQDLGEHTVGETVSFTVPPGTWSVTIYEQEVGDSAPDAVTFQGVQVVNAAVPDDVRMPDGRKLFDDTPAKIPTDANGYDDFTGFLSVHFGAFTPGTGTATFPNATRGLELARVAGALPAGTWTLLVNDWGYECTSLVPDCTGGSTASRYRVHVLTKGPLASTGALDLDVYLASDDGGGDPRLTAAQAAGNASLARTFAGVSSLLGQAGVCLETVTFHDLPDWARLRHASTVIDQTQACDELAQLFRLSLAEEPSVHFFLVDELLATQPGTPGTTLLGIDGAVPGPSGLPGSPASGAVAMLGGLAPCSGPFSIRTCEADLLAYVAAHEVGHWLGLFHVTEASGTSFDPLVDTPSCPCRPCGALTGNGCGTDQVVVSTTDCRTSFCGGASNLMFWLIGEGTVGQLTREQAEVIRLNPAVRQE
jgi:hypothetical protein